MMSMPMKNYKDGLMRVNIFVDGYFVLDDERYISFDDKGVHLSQKAKLLLNS